MNVHPPDTRAEEAVELPLAPATDWAQIRSLYEADDLSVREISRLNGVSDTAIHERAKAENWSLRSPETLTANPPSPHVQTTVQTTCKPSPDFRWDPENEDIVVPEQLALAIYQNHWGQVVIRQERAWDEEDDIYIRFNMESLPKVIAKLQAIQRGEE
jgi:hypothetical protein